MTPTIVIDTDPGIDDALALAFAASAALPIDAITVIYGNATIENTARNASYIVDILSEDWPVHVGAARPLTGNARLAESHGNTGLGKLKSNQLTSNKRNEISASAYYHQLAISNEKRVLFCMGPLTNIAEAIVSNPDIHKNLDQVIIMGGAFAERGNVTEFAEFNVINDPVSFSRVIDYLKTKHVITRVIPVEICRKVLLLRKDAEILEKSMTMPNIRKIVDPYIDYYTAKSEHGEYEGAVIYDVLVPLCYVRPELFDFDPVTISTHIVQDELYGQTTYKKSSGSSVLLCSAIDGGVAKECIMDVLCA